MITQNVDELHRVAGSENLIELHGTLYKTRCTRCEKISPNRENPIVEALSNITEVEKNRKIELDALPKCQDCSGLLRPHIVWFNESLSDDDMSRAHDVMDECDLVLVIGTSSVVYPAAMFAPAASSRGVPIAEFNLEPTLASKTQGFFFQGPCGQTLPKALGIKNENLK